MEAREDSRGGVGEGHSGHGVDTDDRGKNVIPRIGMLDRKRIEWTKQRSLWQNRLNCDCNRREERGNRPHTVISQRRITFSRQGKRGTLGQYTGNHGEINRFRGNHRAPTGARLHGSRVWSNNFTWVRNWVDWMV